MLLKKSSIERESHIYSEEETYRLISNRQFIEALLLLNQVDYKSTSTLFNEALCNYFGGFYTDAIVLLNEALSIYPKSISSDMPMSEKMRELFMRQNQLDTHLCPMTLNYSNNFPTFTWYAIKRLEVDCLVELKQWKEVIEQAQQLIKYQFKNVSKALELAHNHIL